MTEAIPHTDTLNLEKVISFLQEIGIAVHFDSIPDQTFLPGLKILKGGIIVDMEKLMHPGDIVHEAGHLAVVPAAERFDLCEENICNREMRDAEEMMAIAWSYAACLQLGIDPTFVFHDKGYQGDGANIAENFKEGRYFGVPMLQWVGMARERPVEGEEDIPVYPAMLKWLRD